MKNPKPDAKVIPTFIVEAAQKMLAEAPDMSVSQITAAFKSLGVDTLVPSSPESKKRAA
jgi:hypothetical protein